MGRATPYVSGCQMGKAEGRAKKRRDNFNQGVTRSEERDLRSPTKMTSLDKIQAQSNVVMMGRGEKGEGEGGCVYVDGKESWREMAARLAKGGIPN